MPDGKVLSVNIKKLKKKKNDSGDTYFGQLPEYHEMQTLPRTTKESDLSY